MRLQDRTFTKKNRLSKSIVGGVILVGLAVALFAGYVSRPIAPSLDKSQVLTADASSLDFGEVWPQKEFHWSLPVTNRSSAPVRIGALNVSCGCTHSVGLPLDLKPGETKSLGLLIDLSRPDRKPGQGSSPFRVTVEPVLFENRWRASWDISGIVKIAYRTSMSEIDFQDVVLGSEIKQIPIELTYLPDVSDVKASCDRLFATVRTEQLDSQRGRYRIIAALRPDIEVGIHSGLLSIDAKSSDNVAIRESLPIRANVVNNLRCVPTGLYMGISGTGKAITQSVVLSQRDGAQFKITAIEPKVTSLFSIKSQPKSGLDTFSAEHRLELLVAPNGAGVIDSAVIVRTEEIGGRKSMSEIPLSLFARE